MKKLVFSLLIAVLMLALFSCGGGEPISQEGPEEHIVHTFGEWETVTPATCLTEGTEERVCTGCPELESRNTPISDTHIAGEDGFCAECCAVPLAPTPGVTYILSPDGSYAIVCGYTGAGGRINIAEEYEGKPVEEIAAGAFRDLGTLERLSLPDSIKRIGADAFFGAFMMGVDHVLHIQDLYAYCNIEFENRGASPMSDVVQVYFDGVDSEMRLDIPDGITRIPAYAFATDGGTNYGFVSVTLPDSVTEIGEGAFLGNTCKDGLSFGTGLKKIGKEAFGGRLGVEELVIPDSVTEIGESAFYYGDMKSVVIGTGVERIGMLAFQDCVDMVSLTIKSGVKEIGEKAFFCCRALTDVSIPATVRTVGASAFSSCESLRTLIIANGVERLEDRAFQFCNSLTEVHIPASVNYSYCAFQSCDSITKATFAVPDGWYELGTAGENEIDAEYLSDPVQAILFISGMIYRK